mgnify:CR=1 FL=1
MSEKWKQRILLFFPFAILAAGMILISTFFLYTYRQIAFEHTSAPWEILLTSSPRTAPPYLQALENYNSLTALDTLVKHYLDTHR